MRRTPADLQRVALDGRETHARGRRGNVWKKREKKEREKKGEVRMKRSGRVTYLLAYLLPHAHAIILPRASGSRKDIWTLN